MKAKSEITESVKVNQKILRKVRKHVKKSKQGIGGFYDLAAQEKMIRDNHMEIYYENGAIYATNIKAEPNKQ